MGPALLVAALLGPVVLGSTAGCGTRASAQQAGPSSLHATPSIAAGPRIRPSPVDVSPDEEVVELDDTVMMDLGASRGALAGSYGATVPHAPGPPSAGPRVAVPYGSGGMRVGPYANGVSDPGLFPAYYQAPASYPVDPSGDPILGLDVPVEDLGGHALDHFHQALVRAQQGAGQARITVFGASHVASDTWTATTRRLLQGQYGDAGHGFVLPAEPWRGYRHCDVTVRSARRLWQSERFRMGQEEPARFGLAGVAVVAADPSAWARLDTGTSNATQLELFFERQPGGGTFDVSVDGGPGIPIATNDVASRADYRLFEVPDGRHTLEVRARGDGPIKLYGVSSERRVPGVVLDALGINGARIASQLYWDEALFAEHLARRSPDLVVLAYGTNESGDDDVPISDYELRVREIVARVRRVTPSASCLLIGPSDRPIMRRDGTAEPRLRTLEIIASQRRVARDYGCGFFDLVAFGGGPLHMLGWASVRPSWAQRDRTHFTSRGYARLGEVLAHALTAQ